MDHSDIEDRILADGLGALGAASGGSGRLVRAVAKRLKKDVHEIELLVPLPFHETVERVFGVIGGVGRAVEPLPAGTAEERTIRVVTGGGVGGLNPVVVTARVLRSAEATTEVRLRAAAKEGLIKQRAGEKTAVHLAARLREATGAT
ncbi:hypothetical protein Stsp02_44350 [Streptomyces sp. NBRC 14336]|uniref:hypothetical protein n=1 Tax=Streptomyces sp. NBRC 14336 TaxID=3030992 RepID=UPI0024A06211|nr:hypothetical protein [Streptomyces sp. NBRC 14336]GLW48773.1 hypothetical protein Stsp02_44350 [Streptomyces sp. NBRC 14336]